MVPSGFIYGGAHGQPANGGRGRGTAYHEPTLPSTEYQVGNQCADEVAAPGLQLTQVDPLTTQVGIILSELRQEVQILISVPGELDCLLPGDGAVSVGSGMGHEVVCSLHVSYHIRTPVPPRCERSPPVGPHGPAATSERCCCSCLLCSTPGMPSLRC